MTTIKKCILGLLLTAGLAGCTSSENIIDSAMMDPGKYETYIYSCEQLNDALKAQKTRELQLQKLMEKASQSPGGEMIGLIAYRTEYIQTQADQKLVVKAQIEKKCLQNAKAKGDGHDNSLSAIH
jgi:Flp pilus assembly protein TadD